MILIDTNILVFAHNTDSPHHSSALRLLKKALSQNGAYCVAAQNLTEFFSVITNPRRVETPLSFEETCASVDLFLQTDRIVKILPSHGVLSRWLEMIRRHGIQKQKVFDAYLAATMLENGVREIHTDNVSDFELFEEIQAVNPL